MKPETIIAFGLMLMGLGGIVGAVAEAANYQAFLAITGMVATGALGWLAKSPVQTNGNGGAK